MFWRLQRACYEIEKRGVQRIENLQEDYFSTLGFPLLDIINILKNRGELYR